MSKKTTLNAESSSLKSTEKMLIIEMILALKQLIVSAVLM